MIIKIYKSFVYFISICLLFSSCSTVRKAFDPERKNSSEEFLVEKKSPLSMPPDFEKLPIPKNNEANNQNEEKNIEELILTSDKNLKEKEVNVSSDVENSILEKIKKN
tara:strand:+ start:257 stop:580 length:324 start_codon:yes stop_codon:yes gene_type:complete